VTDFCPVGSAEHYDLGATVGDMIGSEHPTMRLYDTRRGAVVPFDPPEIVRMYVCGITPYDATHLGHAATYITYDILQRRLIDRGHEVRYVRNITDVDDDILRAAAKRDVHYLDLAFGETARFDEDMEALNTLAPWSEPRATGAIPDVRGVINAIVEAGNAYETAGSVFFDTRSAEDFGQVASLGHARMQVLAEEWGEKPDDPAKRDPLDFVLWRPSAAGEPAWESRWGRGRPGWHIECTALALRELGKTIDLHGGGVDLLYPHHECVNAQSEAATGEPFVRHWLHQSMVHLDGRKMSKSTGNLVFVHELRDRVHAMAIRLALMIHHYRRPWNWTDSLLDEAIVRLAEWNAAGPGVAALAGVRAALDNDLDVPAAMRAIDRAASAGEGVSEAAKLLGVRLGDEE
jgi:L-cysteine:1D-myo-inositol 2-amino-2-deoxy-alpha-D-glucopyranoside ligase